MTKEIRFYNSIDLNEQVINDWLADAVRADLKFLLIEFSDLDRYFASPFSDKDELDEYLGSFNEDRVMLHLYDVSDLKEIPLPPSNLHNE